MEERKEIVNRYIYKGLNAKRAAAFAGFSKSAYYYKSSGNKKGKKPTDKTLTVKGELIDNKIVIDEIKKIIKPDFIDYGYDKVTHLLKEEGYIINRKKVYRLMKKHRLLNPKDRPSTALKTYVRYSQPYPGRPFESLEIDIKYIYIAGDNANAFLITILDVFTRKALVWDLAFSMKSDRVIELFQRLIKEYLQPYNLLNEQVSVTIRSDNGSQFVAKKVRQFLQENQIFQEFIKPATPQQNAYIESFHSLVEKLVCTKFEFDSLFHARQTFEKFYDTYNNKRIIKKLKNLTPSKFFEKFYNGEIVVAYNIKTKKQLIFFRKQQAA
jgi:transposase InsO family protein